MRPTGIAFVAVLICVSASGCLEQGDRSGKKPPPPQTTQSASATTTSKPAVSLTPAQAPPTAKPAFGFTPTLEAVSGKQGKVEYKVQLPQVTGDNAAARDRFNEGMRVALNDVVRGLDDPKLTKPATVSDGNLWARESSRVYFIGAHVLAGIAVFSHFSGGPYPSNSVATATINTDTAQPIMFGDVFRDQEPAREKLRKLVQELGQPDRVKAAGDMDSEEFLHWLPAPTGLTFYVVVPHVAGDYVPVTVPWERIRDLVAPDMQKILSQ